MQSCMYLATNDAIKRQLCCIFVTASAYNLTNFFRRIAVVMSKHPLNVFEKMAAVDLGSNSFHMIVAQAGPHELKIIDRIREPVRLASGLDEKCRLRPEALERALQCLQRFGQRVRGWPMGSVRIVGTNTLRRVKDRAHFLHQAEQALGHPVEIISGIEEARLVYLGVVRSLATDKKKRLVVDIGGSSTELIIGIKENPRYMESLHAGCVTYTQRFFNDGIITEKKLQQAELAALLEFEPVTSTFKKSGWSIVNGASGTIRAVGRVLHEQGWSREGITLPALAALSDAMIDGKQIANLKSLGISQDRASVFPGGVAVLRAVFRSLGIEQMTVANGALREGLLFDLFGRVRHEDVRDKNVALLAERYHVDQAQVQRVTVTLQYCYEQVADSWELSEDNIEQLLEWSVELHEIGLDIAHAHYHRHGAYVVEYADLLGFSRNEQQLLALLVRGHRRKFPQTQVKQLLERWQKPMQYMIILLRLAVLLHRSRADVTLPDFDIVADKMVLQIGFPDKWLDQHALTQADLQAEKDYLSAMGFELNFK